MFGKTIEAITDLFKSQDLFGYKLNFNYKKKSDSYRSCPGGFFSILIWCAILFIFIVRAK